MSASPARPELDVYEQHARRTADPARGDMHAEDEVAEDPSGNISRRGTGPTMKVLVPDFESENYRQQEKSYQDRIQSLELEVIRLLLENSRIPVAGPGLSAIQVQAIYSNIPADVPQFPTPQQLEFMRMGTQSPKPTRNALKLRSQSRKLGASTAVMTSATALKNGANPVVLKAALRPPPASINLNTPQSNYAAGRAWWKAAMFSVLRSILIVCIVWMILSYLFFGRPSTGQSLSQTQPPSLFRPTGFIRTVLSIDSRTGVSSDGSRSPVFVPHRHRWNGLFNRCDKHNPCVDLAFGDDCAGVAAAAAHTCAAAARVDFVHVRRRHADEPGILVRMRVAELALPHAVDVPDVIVSRRLTAAAIPSSRATVQTVSVVTERDISRDIGGAYIFSYADRTWKSSRLISHRQPCSSPYSQSYSSTFSFSSSPPTPSMTSPFSARSDPIRFSCYQSRRRTRPPYAHLPQQIRHSRCRAPPLQAHPEGLKEQLESSLALLATIRRGVPTSTDRRRWVTNGLRIGETDIADTLFGALLLLLDNNGKNYARLEAAGVHAYLHDYAFSHF
ncbi:hypothetical protein HYPSUDRAFT_207033 [Hypholoma sublateritium FD-334 SS-4]|uniref:Uncharacterized protein n=1 Tax=Hypholoma sublateritium (strain FD-334 SS-4) TaxID=945553 RepID=A0A0D2KP91_HYPSF|nr:hypothetical protein HYPSUDRAFT_207033 [Hypholoma sublateritium FD-334 SS-4]